MSRSKIIIICDINRILGRLTSKKREVYDRVIGISIDSSVDEYINLAKAIDLVDRVDVIGCYDEKFQMIAAKVAKILNLDFLSEDTIDNKFNMRKNF
ncbi:hypothetical protein [Tepidimicrobium xylanilyticum]|uniref:Uncharacterized protein n=1 Tax=Tepidimicrobium xylanilyticum TaxID=1123352 RepID=A0A1H3EE24_9FIRM|nr:hypothetical protein [Tepidimicrobium xylanilyticum]GMG96598.1 hypothetical protein EN5CB1_14240 [Tepidimicrobium xylanilyticum]SDX76992.1 hypothetical protein SAMN05660923_02898 [Tepidimicrobium xylanilyticum]